MHSKTTLCFTYSHFHHQFSLFLHFTFSDWQNCTKKQPLRSLIVLIPLLILFLYFTFSAFLLFIYSLFNFPLILFLYFTFSISLCFFILSLMFFLILFLHFTFPDFLCFIYSLFNYPSILLLHSTLPNKTAQKESSMLSWLRFLLLYKHQKLVLLILLYLFSCDLYCLTYSLVYRELFIILSWTTWRAEIQAS